MKKLIILGVLAIVMTSCNSKINEPRVCPMWNTKDSKAIRHEKVEKDTADNYTIVGCE